jgi:hypothetical protein
MVDLPKLSRAERATVVPFPQGDIRDKQRRLSSHQYVSIFDFASGFFALHIDEAVQPYIVMFVPGKGYYAYLRMPFRLTDPPTEFGHMCATRLHDLLGKEIMELFVDDGGTAANEFSEMMRKLRIIFARFQEEGMSLSATKTKLFMTEAVFAGATVGPKGVALDTLKHETRGAGLEFQPKVFPSTLISSAELEFDRGCPQHIISVYR